MKFINSNALNIDDIIKPINESLIMALAQVALKCKSDTERYNLRDTLYSSKYIASNLESKEAALEAFLNRIGNSNVRTENQNKEYKWIKINTNKMDKIFYRFYIAPNPDNMHEIVKRLVEIFIVNNVPVRFKYQLTSNMEQCDRIIIYSDFDHKSLVEESIKSVYQSYPYLFNDCERSVAWIYNSSIPGVYFAPETPGDAYSERLADVILEAKNTFNYIYGLTSSNRNLILSGKEVDKAIENMKSLIVSIMLRKGIILSKDDKCLSIKDPNVKVNYNDGILEHFNTDSRGYYSVKFYPTLEGKKALLNNFYSVSTIQPQKGLETRYLTPSQRRDEVNKMLYPSLYSDQEGYIDSSGRKVN